MLGYMTFFFSLLLVKERWPVWHDEDDDDDSQKVLGRRSLFVKRFRFSHSREHERGQSRVDSTVHTGSVKGRLGEKEKKTPEKLGNVRRFRAFTFLSAIIYAFLFPTEGGPTNGEWRSIPYQNGLSRLRNQEEQNCVKSLSLRQEDN